MMQMMTRTAAHPLKIAAALGAAFLICFSCQRPTSGSSALQGPQPGSVKEHHQRLARRAQGFQGEGLSVESREAELWGL